MARDVQHATDAFFVWGKADVDKQTVFVFVAFLYGEKSIKRPPPYIWSGVGGLARAAEPVGSLLTLFNSSIDCYPMQSTVSCDLPCSSEV